MSQIPFLPVPRSPRHDGWSPERQWAFVQALADTGSVSQAARIVGKSVGSANALRRHPLAAGFRAACDAALAQASCTIEEVALDRVLNGEVETFTRGDGESIERRRPCSDRLLIHMLKTRERAAERRQARREAAEAEAAKAGRVAAMLALARGEAPPQTRPKRRLLPLPRRRTRRCSVSPRRGRRCWRPFMPAAAALPIGPMLAPGLVVTPAGLRPDPGPAVALAPAQRPDRCGHWPRRRACARPAFLRPRRTAAERAAEAFCASWRCSARALATARPWCGSARRAASASDGCRKQRYPRAWLTHFPHFLNGHPRNSLPLAGRATRAKPGGVGGGSG